MGLISFRISSCAVSFAVDLFCFLALWAELYLLNWLDAKTEFASLIILYF